MALRQNTLNRLGKKLGMIETGNYDRDQVWMTQTIAGASGHLRYVLVEVAFLCVSRVVITGAL
jgi:hypothetical protein